MPFRVARAIRMNVIINISDLGGSVAPVRPGMRPNGPANPGHRAGGERIHHAIWRIGEAEAALATVWLAGASGASGVGWSGVMKAKRHLCEPLGRSFRRNVGPRVLWMPSKLRF